MDLNDVVTPALVAESKKLEENPALILALVDLIFLGMEDSKVIPS